MIGRNNISGVSMTAATLGGMNSYVRGQVEHDKTVSAPTDFLMLQTPTGLERSLATISIQMTQKAQQLKMAAQPLRTVAKSAVPQTQTAAVSEYEKIKQDITASLTSHQRARFVQESPGAFLSHQAEPDFSFMAENRLQAAMAEAPSVTSISQGEVMEKFMDETMDETIKDYATAKSAVKESFLGRMVGPAFAAGALAAVATMLPYPVGASDIMQYPDMKILADQGLNPSVIDSSLIPHQFPTVSQYFATFLRNAIITGTLAASPAIYNYIKLLEFGAGEMNKVQQQPKQETA